MKKILFISASAKISGAEISMIDNLEKLNNKKYDIHVIIPKNCDYHKRLKNRFNIRTLNIQKLTVSYNPFIAFIIIISIIFYSIQITKYVKKNKIDIVYSNSFYSQIYCVLFKIFLKSKLIWHVRDNYKGIKKVYIFPLISDKIICVSNYIANQMRYNSKKQIIYGGLDIKYWKPLKTFENNLRENLQLGDDVKLVAQVGQMVKWKNHMDFILAAKIMFTHYNKVHFLFVGTDLFGTDSKYIQALKRAINKEGLEQHITFLGGVENMKDIYQQINILVHPALNEPFGRVLIEAMCMEKTVIAYKMGGISEIIEDEHSGFLIEPKNYKSIAEKGVQLLKTDLLCEKIGKNARESVISKFNIEDTRINIESVLDIL